MYKYIIITLLIIFLTISCSKDKSENYKTCAKYIGLSIYSDAYPNSKIINTIPFENRLRIISNKIIKGPFNEQFIKIQFNDTEGWVDSKYLSNKTHPSYIGDKCDTNYVDEFKYNRIKVFKLALNTFKREYGKSHFYKDYDLSKACIYAIKSKNENNNYENVILIIFSNTRIPNEYSGLCFEMINDKYIECCSVIDTIDSYGNIQNLINSIKNGSYFINSGETE